MLEFETNMSERWGTDLLTIRLKRKDKPSSELPKTPNKGLHAYTEADKVIFFGRDREVEELKSKIQDQPLTVVTGPSGIGKSSLIQAGLIPQLREDGWNILPVIRPGTQPMRELEKKISDLSSLIIDQQATLLVIDAYEELITQTKDPSEQNAFVQQLADWLQTEYPYLSIVIIVRADLEEQVPKGDLSTSWGWGKYDVPPLTMQQINVIISQMALYAELEMGEEFAARIIDDLTDLETPLPYLSYALNQLFEKKLAEPGNRYLRLSDYIDMGQVGIAIHLQLENIYAELGSGAENLLRVLFEMVSFDTDIPTPKAVSIYELGSRSTDELNVKLSLLRSTLQPIAERLVEAELLISGINHDEVKYYEPAHEVLLSAWPRLVEWIQVKQPKSSTPPTSPDSKIDQRIWDEVLDSINRDNCVLILGPGAMVDHKGYPLQTRLRQAFANQIHGSDSDVPGSLLGLGDQLGRKIQKLRAVRDVYSQDQVHDIYSLLAYIPFSLILSTSPDTLLHQAFEQQAIEHQFAYYNYKDVNEDISYPSKESPLIYNVFGSWRDYDSLILSNRDLFDFLLRILDDYGSRSLPAPLKEKLSTSHSFVFLGFDFYTREYDLLLHFLRTHQKDVNFAFVNSIQLEDTRRDLLEKHFHIDFVEHNPLDFIRECYQRCSKVAILREISRPNLHHQVSKMLEDEQIESAIDVLEEYFQDKEEDELFSELLKVSADYRRQERWLRTERISRAEFDLQLNQSMKSLLEIAKDLDSRENAKETSTQTVKKPAPDQISTLIQAPFTPVGSSGRENISPNTMSAVEWHDLLDGLEDQSSILVLGPGASLGRNGEHLHNKLCSLMEDFLDTNMADHPDRLFLLGDKIKEGKNWRQRYYDFTNQTYSEASPHEIHEKLTFIPFHLIINTSPDSLVQQSFHQLGTRNHVAHYNYQKPSELDANPSDFNPLIYNLFGSLDDEDSLVMNHDHLFEFLFSLLGSNPLPSGFREEIRKAKQLVFLGVDFDSWYVKFLLYLFEAHDKGINYAIPWRADGLTIANRAFYVQNFQLNFVDGDVENFVNELYDRCTERRLVREPDEDAGVVYPYEEVQELIEKNEVEDAILFVEDFSEKIGDEDITSEALGLRGRYRRLKRKEKAEILTKEEAALERAKIIDSLLELAKELDDQIP